MVVFLEAKEAMFSRDLETQNEARSDRKLGGPGAGTVRIPRWVRTKPNLRKGIRQRWRMVSTCAIYVSTGSSTHHRLRLHPAKYLERDGRVPGDLRKR